MILQGQEKMKQCLIHDFQLSFQHSGAFNINGNFIASIRDVVILISKNAYHFLGSSVKYVYIINHRTGHLRHKAIT